MVVSEPTVKQMLEDLMLEIEIESLRFGQDFVKSLNESFEKHGSLTEKQAQSLRKIYRSHIGN